VVSAALLFAGEDEEPLFSTIAPSGRRVTCVDERTYSRVCQAMAEKLVELAEEIERLKA